MESTIYDVQVNYSVSDRASGALERLSGSASRAERGVVSVKEALLGLGEAFLAKEAFAKGKELLIDANAEMEMLKLSMTSIVSFNLSKPFAEAQGETNKLVEDWVQFSKTVPLTMKEVSQFGATITSGVMGAGGSMEDLKQISEKGALIGKILAGGHAGGTQYAAMEINEALMGDLRKTQMFNMQLLGPTMKKMGLEIKNWNTLAAEERKRIIIAALSDPAWGQSRKALESTYEAAITTLQDNIQIAAREIGGPLFEQVKGVLQEVNKWFADHPEQLKAFAKELTGYLKEGFSFVRSTIGVLIDNKDVLIAIGRMWVSGQVLGAASSIGRSLATSVATFATGLGEASTGLSGLASNFGTVTTALSLFYTALSLVAKGFDESHKQRIERTADFSTMHDYLLKGRGDERNAVVRAKAMGLFDENGKLDVGKARTMFEGLANGTEDQQAALIEVPKMVRSLEALVAFLGPEEMADRVGRNKPGSVPDVASGKKKDPTKVSVTIHKIEIPASDPDRFVHGLVKKFERVARNPVAAESQWRGGY